jgi:pyrroline-5-carboxylate reductase
MMLGVGASAVAFSDNLSEAERIFVISLLNSCGISEEIPADKMKEIIAVNGSSPAFIFEFAKHFIDYARSQNIDGEAAARLFSQTLIGAGKMLNESGKSADELIAQVTSKGGTTIAGLEQLRQNGLDRVVRSACEACTSRAYELSQNI